MIRLAALLVFGLSACGEEAVAPEVEQQLAPATVATIGAERLSSHLDMGGVQLIDVRTPEEFAEGHIPGAINVPLDDFDPAALPAADGRQRILYCRTARRSEEAAERLSRFSGKPATHLAGGIESWKNAGFTVQR